MPTENEAPSTSSSDSVHLLVLVHGMWGHTGHLAQMARAVKEERPEFHVLLAKANEEDSTYDGIDWGGERVAKEIVDEISHLRSEGKVVRQFSMTGYSLGGLVSRYVAGVLFQRGFFSPDSPDYMIPVNFLTIATPHLGLIKYDTLLSSITHKLGPRFLSRTGEQFYCVDKWGKTGRPILDIMSDPSMIFYQALTAFKVVKVYANAIRDLTVPYVTAAIETEDPFAEYETNGIELKFQPNYYPVIASYILPPTPPLKPKTKILSISWLERRKQNSTPASSISGESTLSSLPSSEDQDEKPVFHKAGRLPPFLNYPFPINLLIYAAIPILFPTVLSLALIRFTRASRASKERITLLERDDIETKSEHQSLAQVLTNLERQVEETVADFIVEDPSSIVPKVKASAHPILTPLQRTICARLNAIPQLKKEIAFITGVANTHSGIISRHEMWDKHGYGLNVLRHWAGSLVVSEV
ncbi:hypothetical protein D9757_000390 [Collybiopsis confluens]|uniref:DUF676 domain-containing protein n=1 Tax=Collybiopsis confluens TaxID=2823264 RepID=A0A8H5I1S3_9AGAR|nr:hypothetical protein D9757_000390 [Collybiopsis confluens]